MEKPKYPYMPPIEKPMVPPVEMPQKPMVPYQPMMPLQPMLPCPMPMMPSESSFMRHLRSMVNRHVIITTECGKTHEGILEGVYDDHVALLDGRLYHIRLETICCVAEVRRY